MKVGGGKSASHRREGGNRVDEKKLHGVTRVKSCDGAGVHSRSTDVRGGKIK